MGLDVNCKATHHVEFAGISLFNSKAPIEKRGERKVPAVPVLSLLKVNPAFSRVVASPTAGASPLLPAG